MSATAVAAAGAAVWYYFWRSRAADNASFPVETHTRAHRAPDTWMEALYFFAEGLRYMYGETLGKWRTADLLIGLAYLARRESEEHPCSEVAEQGTPLGEDMQLEQCQQTLDDMRVVQRFMKYCLAMRERRLKRQEHAFRNIGIEPHDVLKTEPRAAVLRPSFVIIRDRKLQSIVLAIRGTHSLKDAFTNLTGASKPHHVLDEQGLVLGHCHFGMLAAARWIKSQVAPLIPQYLTAHPGYTLRITGHSLGGGTAAILTMMLREEYPDVTCVSIACPGCMTLELARSCRSYVTTVVNGTDLVPSMSPAAADALRQEVMQSAWYEAFRKDLRSSFIVRAVEGSLRQVGSATMWTAQATSASFSACYQRAARAPPLQVGGPCSPRPMSRKKSGDEEEDKGTEHRPTTGPLGCRTVPLARPWGVQGLRQRGNPGARGAAVEGWWEEDELLIEVAREWARRDEATHMEAPLDEAARPLDSMDRGQGAATPPSTTAQSSTMDNAPAIRGGAAQQPSRPSTPRAGLLSRWWWQGCRTGRASVSRSFLERYEREMEERAWAEEMEAWSGQAPNLSDAPAAARMSIDMVEGDDGADGALDSDLANLSQQLNQGLCEVEAAVSQEGAIDDVRLSATAERQPLAQEMQQHPAGGGTDADQAGPSSSAPSQEALLARRKTYPAGRILHILPAYLLLGEDALYEDYVSQHGAAQLASPLAPSRQSSLVSGHAMLDALDKLSHDASVGHTAGPPPALPEGSLPSSPVNASTVAHEGEHHVATQVQPSAGGEAGLTSDQGLMGHEEEGSDGTGEAPADVPHTDRLPSRASSMRPELAGKGQKGRRVRYMLLDNVPHECYGRIRLCRTMIQDHFIPSYAANMESALHTMIEMYVLPQHRAAADSQLQATARV